MQRILQLVIFSAALMLIGVGDLAHAQDGDDVQVYITADDRYRFEMPPGDWLVTEDENITITNSRRDFTTDNSPLRPDEFVAFIILPEQIALLGWTPSSSLTEVSLFLPAGKFEQRTLGDRVVIEHDQSSPNGDFRSFYVIIPDAGLASVGLVTAPNNFETYRDFAEGLATSLALATPPVEATPSPFDGLVDISTIDLDALPYFTKLYVTDNLNVRMAFPSDYDIIEVGWTVVISSPDADVAGPAIPDTVTIVVMSPTLILQPPAISTADPQAALEQWLNYFPLVQPDAVLAEPDPMQSFTLNGRDYHLLTVQSGWGDMAVLAFALSDEDIAIVYAIAPTDDLDTFMPTLLAVAQSVEINN